MTLPSTTARTRVASHNQLPRVALVGVHGFGERHLENLDRLGSAGMLKLVAVADPRPPAQGQLPPEVGVHTSLDALLAAGIAPDVVIISTPIQTHAPLALTALGAGANVYLEKPPVASQAQYESVLAAAESAGRLVQVGFQSLGSHALPAVEKIVASGEIGEVRGISASGQWLRTKGYFKRSRWAGKRSLNGTDVVDGVATNALAHAVATGLRLAGARTLADVELVETDLYRANDTESDDTSVIRIRTAAGTVLTCALTLCAPLQSAPKVTIYGTLGHVTLSYTEDRLEITTPGGTRNEAFGRTDLLENLLAARTEQDLLSPLSGSGAYVSVLEAVRTADAPRLIHPDHVTWLGEGDDAHAVVHGIESWIRRATLGQATFSELGTPWAERSGDAAGAAKPELKVNGTAVATMQDGSGIRSTSSPRPYLHPVRTLAGTVVTDHIPEDHVWHLGAGVAIQDVDGINFWGGRTYTRDAGAYVWRKDHGRIVLESAEDVEGARHERLNWIGPDGKPLLREQRGWRWAAVGNSVWQLTLDFALESATGRPVLLGSPGSNGRPQGGYGGFFWRLPKVSDATIWTPDLRGEDAVHGSVAPWLAWSGTFDAGTGGSLAAGGPGLGHPATLVFLASPQAPDPWFVRHSGYPGVGLSLAWESPVAVEPGRPVHRTVKVLIADGFRATEDIEQLISTQGDPA
jgi:predicted dehydrogenase